MTETLRCLRPHVRGFTNRHYGLATDPRQAQFTVTAIADAVRAARTAMPDSRSVADTVISP